MFDASVVSASTAYSIGYGRSPATGTLTPLFPDTSSVTVVSSTSVDASGCCSGQNHWRPNEYASRPGGAKETGLRVTVNFVDAPASGAPNRYALVALAATVAPRCATSGLSVRSTLKFGGLNSATRKPPSISPPLRALA